MATTYEMLTAGTMRWRFEQATGEFGKVHPAAIPPRAWLALAYLIVFGSLVAFSAYRWLLGNAPLSLTATYAYVNPVVAVILGALTLGEQVTWPILIGGAVVVAGVGLVVSAERPRRRAARPADPGDARAGRAPCLRQALDQAVVDRLLHREQPAPPRVVPDLLHLVSGDLGEPRVQIGQHGPDLLLVRGDGGHRAVEAHPGLGHGEKGVRVRPAVPGSGQHSEARAAIPARPRRRWPPGPGGCRGHR